MATPEPICPICPCCPGADRVSSPKGRKNVTCEDYEDGEHTGENHSEGLLATGARRLSSLIASRLTREWAHSYPPT
jgi:hypothetical protein